ncbi:sensor histidine kinase [Algoriphagus sp. A40]|uniref:sensor histidine kinase n=1 Tax=Algoriphagus sp. A40 TaxID=1945863 RepID=UPI001C2B94EC|nr:histidine kinase [Algoriphagus sp. A40]
MKERDLSWKWALIQFLVFSIAGFSITHFYRNSINRQEFPYDNSLIVGWRIVSTLCLLSLAVVAYDFTVDQYYYKKGFNQDELYYLTLAGYYLDGFVIFLPWFLIFHLYKYGKTIGQLNTLHIQQKVELQQAQLHVVLNKLNPHFLFNTLNTIRWLISKDKEVARQALNELSEIMRYSTRQTSSSLVTLEEELLIVEKYLKIEHWRFDDNLDYELVCPAQLLAKRIAPFLILNLVENAVKHGISQHLNGGIVEIRIFEYDNYLNIEVSNPGKIADLQSGFGLTSVSKLLKILFGKDSNISIEQRGDKVITAIKLRDHAL